MQINYNSETFELIFSPSLFSIISATSINFILRKYSDYANPLTYSYYIYIDETKCYTFEDNIDRAIDKSFVVIFLK